MPGCGRAGKAGRAASTRPTRLGRGDRGSPPTPANAASYAMAPAAMCGQRVHLQHYVGLWPILLQKSPNERCGIGFCNNRIGTRAFLNQRCASGRDFESLFRARGPKIVLQQYRPEPANRRCPLFRRSWGQSGRTADEPKSTLLTRSGFGRVVATLIHPLQVARPLRVRNRRRAGLLALERRVVGGEVAAHGNIVQPSI
jgi:hypothetical protein